MGQQVNILSELKLQSVGKGKASPIRRGRNSTYPRQQFNVLYPKLSDLAVNSLKVW